MARLNELSRESLDAVAVRMRSIMLLHGTEKLERKLICEAGFGETLRFVSNRRIGDMANVLSTPMNTNGEVAND